MAKKRFCLIGRELGSGSPHGAYLDEERLHEVFEWAQRNAFDGVAVLSPMQGLVVAGDACPEGESGVLTSMHAKARSAWAGRVCDQVVERWKLTEAPAQLVLLCGLSGYQELAEALQERLPGSSVTRPLAGTGIVNRSHRLLEARCVESVPH
jgi:hypothetical protein